MINRILGKSRVVKSAHPAGHLPKAPIHRRAALWAQEQREKDVRWV
jgi:hypothetical protein